MRPMEVPVFRSIAGKGMGRVVGSHKDPSDLAMELVPWGNKARYLGGYPH